MNFFVFNMVEILPTNCDIGKTLVSIKSTIFGYKDKFDTDDDRLVFKKMVNQRFLKYCCKKCSFNKKCMYWKDTEHGRTLTKLMTQTNNH